MSWKTKGDPEALREALQACPQIASVETLQDCPGWSITVEGTHVDGWAWCYSDRPMRMGPRLLVSLPGAGEFEIDLEEGDLGPAAIDRERFDRQNACLQDKRRSADVS